MAAGRSAGFFDNSPFYGTAVSSSEILQQLRYALGFLEIPWELEPLLTGYRELAANLTFELPHDLLFVEITGRRVLSIDGVVLQPNSVGFYFAERASLGEGLTRFWGPDARQNRLKYLSQDPAFDDATAEERRLLTEAQTDVLTDDDIAVDLRRMHALVGNRLVVVSPAIDESAPETVKKAAAEMIAALRIACGQLGLPLFDPTAALAEFRAEHGFGASSADAPLLVAAFESYLAGVLAREYLLPLKQSDLYVPRPPSTGDDPRSAEGVLSRMIRRLFRSAAAPEAAPQPGADRADQPDDLAAALEETRRAAWYGEWRSVAARAQTILGHAKDDPVLCERAATAFWYAGDKEAALRLWRRAVSRPPAPLRLVEAAELAFQAGSADLGVEWCCAAAPQSPDAAVAALRTLDAHARADALPPLLDRIAGIDGMLSTVIPRLPATGGLRPAVIEFALLRGLIDPEAPTAKTLVQQWLNTLAQDFRDGRLDAMRGAMIRFDALPDGNAFRQSARQYLTRALIKALRENAETRLPSETESLAREILAINPFHSEATLTLARVFDQRGDRASASQLLDELSCAHPAAVAIQFAAITQWLAWGDIEAASVAYERCRAACGSSEDLAELRKRLFAGIEREERAARAARQGARADEMRRLLAALNAAATAA
jgi:hypothetical protein